MGVLRAKCPGCGLLVLRNDAERKISHEVPQCAWFRELLANAGTHTSGVEALDPETGRKAVKP